MKRYNHKEKAVNEYRIPCGRTTGQGSSCDQGQMCCSCAEIARLRNLLDPHRIVIEAKLIDGKPAHRLASSPKDAWVISNTAIDAMLDRVILQLGCSKMEIYEATRIPPESVSRCRHHNMPLFDQWILRLSDFSGISVAELRRVACVEPVTDRHLKARRTT